MQAVWAEDAFMPGPSFASDHAMVVAEVAFAERTRSRAAPEPRAEPSAEPVQPVSGAG